MFLSAAVRQRPRFCHSWVRSISRFLFSPGGFNSLRRIRGNRNEGGWTTGRKSNVLVAAAAAISVKKEKEEEKEEARRNVLEEAKHPEDHFDEKRLLSSGWHLLYETGSIRVLRRRRMDQSFETYEYCCKGSYDDVTPRHFLDAQNDLAYRSEWDSNVISLQLISQDDERVELIRWVAKYPYPLYPREYVFTRKCIVSEDEKTIVIESEAVPEEVVPKSRKTDVRVATYSSSMFIRCHHDMETPGFDYVLMYFDNPEANIPSYVYTWIVNRGGPYFLRQVYEAAKELAESGKEIGPTVILPSKRRKTAEAETRCRLSADIDSLHEVRLPVSGGDPRSFMPGRAAFA